MEFSVSKEMHILPKCSLGMGTEGVKALTGCLIRLECVTQPSAPQGAGKVLSLYMSTFYPDGSRNVAHTSRHRVQIKVVQLFQALAFF